MAAVKSLQPRGDYEANNVVIDVEEPLRVDADDREVERLVDVYLREHREQGCMPLRSVANTIFPTSLYLRHGYPEFFRSIPTPYFLGFAGQVTIGDGTLIA